MARRTKKELNLDSPVLERTSTAQVGVWLRGILLRDKCGRIDLFHLNGEGKKTPVRRWALTPEAKGDDIDVDDGPNAVEALHHEIVTEAQDFSEAFGGRQTFVVAAMRKDSPLTVHGQRAFTVTAEGEATDDVGPTEEATPKGHVAQMMRFTENLMRISVGQTADIMAALQLQNRQLSEELEKRRHRDLEEVELRENLISQAHARKLAESKEARAEELQGVMVEKVMGLANVAVARFMANGAKPGEKPPPMLGEDILKSIIADVMQNPEKANQLAAVLGPVKAAELGELIRLYVMRDAEAEQKKLKEGGA